MKVFLLLLLLFSFRSLTLSLFLSLDFLPQLSSYRCKNYGQFLKSTSDEANLPAHRNRSDLQPAAVDRQVST
jgi:hypothetical protein